MIIYDNVWLLMAMDDYGWLCMTVYDYVGKCMTIYVYVLLCMTLYALESFYIPLNSFVCLCITFYMTLNDSERILMIAYDHACLFKNL